MFVGWLGLVSDSQLTLASCLARLVCCSALAAGRRSYPPQAWLV